MKQTCKKIIQILCFLYYLWNSSKLKYYLIIEVMATKKPSKPVED